MNNCDVPVVQLWSTMMCQLYTLNILNTFRDTQQISNTKRKCYFKDGKTYENKFRRLNNIADELQKTKNL